MGDSLHFHLLVLALPRAAQISTRHFGSMTRFSEEELAKACDDFDDDCILGEGGFAVVYKGRLEQGIEVAIKRIKVELVNRGWCICRGARHTCLELGPVGVLQLPCQSVWQVQDSCFWPADLSLCSFPVRIHRTWDAMAHCRLRR